MRDPVVLNEKKINTKSFLWGGVVGFIVGSIISFGFLVLFSMVTNISGEDAVTYFDVDFNGEVHRLHTGMPKDSVIQILGQPRHNSMRKSVGHVREDMTFYSDIDLTSKSHTTMISLEFEDGKLKEYSVY